MEFLVEMELRLPPDMAAERRAELFTAEAARAGELARAGTLRRLWRIPGRTANSGLWEAPDATALHAALESLPLWPWMDMRVTALAAHPNDPGDGGPADGRA
jgi:muconolactone D-isomerase